MRKFVSLLLSAALLFGTVGGIVPAAGSDADAFSPEKMEGLLGWYDAADLDLADGAAVSLWPNRAKEGTLDARQSDASRRPTYVSAGKVNQKPAVRLGKSAYLQLQGAVNLSDYSIFAVTNLNGLEGTADSNQIFSKLQLSAPYHHSWYFNLSGGGLNFGWHDAAGYHDYVGGDRAMDVDVSYILGGTKAGGNGRLYINGKALGGLTSTASDPAASACDDPVFIGGRGANGEAWSIDGDICEILLFDRGLSEEETAAVNAYLSEKRGIAIASSLNLEGEILVDGEPLRPFSEEITTYRWTVDKGTTEIPQVTANFNLQSEVRQATSIPGTATVTVGRPAGRKPLQLKLQNWMWM